MDIFLDILAKHLLQKHGAALSNFAFVFPNRRSGLFFQRYLNDYAEETMWVPELKTINELIQDISELQIADPMDIQFDLYDIYSGMTPNPDSFDEFYPWGEMMATDFDQLDKYLVNPSSIFKNIKELKEIDEKFGGLEEEQVAFIRQFWKNFHTGDMSKEKAVFLRTWEMLPGLYSALNEHLRTRREGYEGMLYKEVAELDIDRLDEKLGAKHYFFIGFNALSKCERRLFARMKDKGVASFFWDYDISYKTASSMEAGRFIRQNMIDFPPPDDLEIFSQLQAEKKIRIFNLPTDILQAKTIHKIIKNVDEEIKEVSDMAIVACDENLLLPVLVSIPEEIEQLNITMGYPFKNTPMYGILDSILKLIKNIRRTKAGEVRFYHRDVSSILNHQYFRMIEEVSNTKLQEEMVRENKVYIHPEYFSGEFDTLIFRDIKNIPEFISYLDSIFRFILQKLRGVEEYQHLELEKEYIFLLLSRLNKLEDILKDREPIEFPMFIRLFRKIIVNQRVPFTGEPLAGLQVMGILETRLLDFKHVVLLSMNEDIMPKSSAGNSFIPYSLRFGYELPTREDMDAIYAYYFYRLIQRAEKVDLLYNSASEGVRSGEMSRYLYQMQYSYGAEVISPVLSVMSKDHEIPVVHKTPEVMDLLWGYKSGNEKELYLSPSALNSYIECPLRFYFQKLARISKGEELLEEVDAIDLGKIVHETIAELYETLKEKHNMITAEHLGLLLKSEDLGKSLEKFFNQIFFHNDRKRKIEGKNLIIYEIIRKYLEQIIRADIKIAPFELVDLEQKYPFDLKVEINGAESSIAMGGKIDRIDKLNGDTIRIIDYKTGGAGLRFSTIESLFNSDEKGRNKEAFQALLYCWLYMKKVDADVIQPGLYLLRQINTPDFSPLFRMGEMGEINDFQNFIEHKDEFEALLISLIEEIYKPEIPFSQTPVIERCEYCDFNTLCQRT
jgi:hypothetical protein